MIDAQRTHVNSSLSDRTALHIEEPCFLLRYMRINGGFLHWPQKIIARAGRSFLARSLPPPCAQPAAGFDKSRTQRTQSQHEYTEGLVFLINGMRRPRFQIPARGRTHYKYLCVLRHALWPLCPLPLVRATRVVRRPLARTRDRDYTCDMELDCSMTCLALVLRAGEQEKKEKTGPCP